MPLPPPVLTPPFNVVRISHVALGVPNAPIGERP
jgi:hypothetical protein